MIGFDDLDQEPVAQDRNAQIRAAAHMANGGDAMFPCPSCKGTGKWRGTYVVRPCFKCKGKGKVSKGIAAAAKGKVTKAENDRLWFEANAGIIERAKRHLWNKFVAGLMQQINDNGRISDRQLECLTDAVNRYDAQDAMRRDVAEAKREANSGEIDISAIEALFARALSNDLKRPMFRTEHVTVKQSKYPGVLYVMSSDDVYLGKIADGKFHARREATSDTLEQLRAIAKDPTAEAVKYGRLTSNCGCCGKGLVDPVSIRTGIGPICAKKWGLFEARGYAREEIREEVNEQARREDAIPADFRAKGVDRSLRQGRA